MTEREPAPERRNRRTAGDEPTTAGGDGTDSAPRSGSVDGAVARRALGRLTRGEAATDRAVAARARAATGDLDAALSFVERVGVERLRQAASRLDGPAAVEARATLAAFERYRRAARGEKR